VLFKQDLLVDGREAGDEQRESEISSFQASNFRGNVDEA